MKAILLSLLLLLTVFAYSNYKSQAKVLAFDAAQKCVGQANDNIRKKPKARSEVVATRLIYCFDKAQKLTQ